MLSFLPNQSPFPLSLLQLAAQLALGRHSHRSSFFSFLGIYSLFGSCLFFLSKDSRFRVLRSHTPLLIQAHPLCWEPQKVSFTTPSGISIASSLIQMCSKVSVGCWMDDPHTGFSLGRGVFSVLSSQGGHSNFEALLNSSSFFHPQNQSENISLLPYLHTIHSLSLSPDSGPLSFTEWHPHDRCGRGHDGESLVISTACLWEQMVRFIHLLLLLDFPDFFFTSV